MFYVSGCNDHDYLEDTLYLYQLSTSSAMRVTLSIENGAGQKHCCIPVIYHKPETAFFHPNSRAMVNALEWWLIDRLSMLELYCGS